MSLKDRAIQAAEEHREKSEQEKQEREAKKQADNAAKLKALLKTRLDIDVDPSEGTIEVEGITFAYSQVIQGTYANNYKDMLVVIEKCPECGGDRVSYDIEDIAGLGRVLGNDYFKPHEHYFEEGSEKGKAWMEKRSLKEKLQYFCPFTLRVDGAHQTCDRDRCGAWQNDCARNINC